MVIRWSPGMPRSSRGPVLPLAIFVGTYAPQTLHSSAVKRNRMRRRCREALRVSLRAYTALPVVQVLICPRHASLDAPFADILADARTFLSLLTQ